MRPTKLLAAALLGSAGLPALAEAADVVSRDQVVFDPTPIVADEWIVTLKGTIGISPSWKGSDRYSVFGYPSISYRKVGEPVKFTAPDDSASIALYDTSWLRTGVVVGFDAGRYSGSEARLFGTGDVQWSLQPGVFVDIWPTPYLRARFEGRYATGGVHGLVGNIGLDAVLPYDRWTFAIGPRLQWGSRGYTNDLFGVTPYESALNGFIPPYRASGGITSVGVSASASYTWSEEWTTTVFGSYNRLTQDAASSPIVRAFGSRDQFSAGISAAYSFHTKALW